MKFYPNNCQKCYEVVKQYDVRLFLLLDWGELGHWRIEGGGAKGALPPPPKID